MMMMGTPNPMAAMMPVLPQIPQIPVMPQMFSPPMPQENDSNFLLIAPNSPRFKIFMAFLLFLKTNLKEHTPCICMECWMIVTKSEVQEHRSKHPKQVTPTFAEMKVATDNDIVDLSKKHKRWRDQKCEVFSLG
jgi:hypothetical protein